MLVRRVNLGICKVLNQISTSMGLDLQSYTVKSLEENIGDSLQDMVRGKTS